MAGAQRQRARSSRAAKATPAARGNGRSDPTAGDYAREAIAEWAKAARYAVAAFSPVVKAAGVAGKVDRPPLKDRLNPTKTDKGGRLGDVADFLLTKTAGKAGTVASKFSLGSRAMERLRPGNSGSQQERRDGSGDGDSEAGAFKRLPLPIQESMEVALPAKAVYELARRFEDYPEFIDRIDAVEPVDDKTAVFEVKVRGVTREVRIEIRDERANRRIDWEATEGLAHSAVVSFHELAPSLTHVELTVDLEPRGVIRRLARATHITQHAIRSDLHRFKAWAELAEDVEEPEDEEPPEDYEAEGSEGDEGEESGEPEDIEEEEGEPTEDYEDEDFDEAGPDEDYDEQDVEYDDEQDLEYDDEEEELEPARAR